MSCFVPHADAGGLTTGAHDATATSSSESVAISGGTHVFVSVDTQPVSIRFGRSVDAATVAAGIMIPAGWAGVFKVPPFSTHLHYIRTGGTDGLIGVQFGFLEG